MKLSEKEREVIERLCRGERAGEIAGALKCTPSTVATYVARALAKLEAKTPEHACAIYAKRNPGVLPEPATIHDTASALAEGLPAL